MSYLDRPAYQREAISKAIEERRNDLLPLRREVDRLIDEVGWRRARPIVAEVLGFDPIRQRGAWWARVGKRAGTKLVKRLETEVSLGTGRLF